MPKRNLLPYYQDGILLGYTFLHIFTAKMAPDSLPFPVPAGIPVFIPSGTRAISHILELSNSVPLTVYCSHRVETPIQLVLGYSKD